MGLNSAFPTLILPRLIHLKKTPDNNIMKLHEYQAKEIIKTFGVPVQGGIVATTVEEAVAAG